MRVKFCGITNLDDAAEAVQLGAWAVGLIHFHGSPRNVDPGVAAESRLLLFGASARWWGCLSIPTLDEVAKAVEDEGLTMVQLNGAEGASFCAEVQRRTGLKVAKAIHVASAADVHGAEAFRTDFHLFDRRGKGLWGGTGESFDWELLRGHRSEVPAILAGGLRPDNVAEAIAVTHPYAVDVASGVELEPGRKDHAAMAAFFEAANCRSAPAHERDRGALRALRGPLRAGDPDPGPGRADRRLGGGARRRGVHGAGSTGLRRDFIGRPTPLYLAERLSERVGSRVYLKREDLAHTGAHKINNAVGQALLAARMGKPRVIAETGAGQHGVATATACALLGLECVVYMGTEDIRRQAPNVERMKLLGAEVAPVEAGARTLKEAVSAAIRDWVANVATTHYVIGSAVGPAPYPALVRDLQRVIGEEAREQALAAEGSLPARVIACVGGGSNAIGIFTPFLDDAEVALVGVEAAGEGLDTQPPRRLAAGRRQGRSARLALLGDRRRGGADPRGALDLGRARLPRRRPRARPAARQRPRQLRGGDRRPGARGVSGACPAGGDHPGARVLARDRLADGEPGGERIRRSVSLRAWR